MLKIILLGIIYIVVLSAYIVMPLIGKFILLIINAFVADPLPAIDEIIMVISLGKHIETGTKIIDFIRAHKIISIAILVVIVIGIVILFG